MFGYISTNMAALSESAQKRYRAFYCGLCQTLEQRYALRGRITLSNDMTFLAVLLHSLYEPTEQHESKRCVIHPVSPRERILSPVLNYAADMNILLSYYKCLDHKKDDHSFLQGLEANGLKESFERIAAQYPKQATAVQQSLEKITLLEGQQSRNVDALCQLSGEMLSPIFVWKEDEWAPFLQMIGNGLGKFVYFMDAYEDYEADIKKGRFNPLKDLHEQSDYEELSKQIMQMFLAEATEAFELLPLEQDLDILRNVLYSGIWFRYEQYNVRKKRGCSKK